MQSLIYSWGNARISGSKNATADAYFTSKLSANPANSIGLDSRKSSWLFMFAYA